MFKQLMKLVRGDRGSALLMSLMVMVGLSLLGLGFVAISETENAISVNHRNAAQTQALAEAGARAVVEWFQRPEWCAPATDAKSVTGAIGIMPANTDANDAAFKVIRMLDPDGPLANPASPQGRIKSLPEDDFFCCDRPFKLRINDRFYGAEANPDIKIDNNTPEGLAFLTTFNTRLFPGNEGGRVVEIVIYAPPIIGGNLNANNFWDANYGARYGLATIKVTAQKGDPANPSAQRSVKIVVSEWPFPGPQGPIQSNANIQTGGNVAVHWGRMTSQGSMFVKRPLMGLPWMDAYDRVHFEHGLDSSAPWQINKNYNDGDIVHPPLTGPSEAYVKVAPGGLSNSGFVEPLWASAPTIGSQTLPDMAGNVWERRIRTRWPNANSTVLDATDYLYELLTQPGVSVRDFDDPWIECRARGPITNGNITGAAVGNPHPFKYLGVSENELGNPTAGYSNWFQIQNISADVGAPGTRNQKEVIFPRIDYEFWKNTAISGQGNEGVYYLTWVAGENYRDNAGVTMNFAQWTDIEAGRPRGFYFFETKNNQNPQIPGGSSFLTPKVDVNSSDSTNTWTMSGFIYLNSVEFATTGIDGVAGRFSFPGEPYRDVGYWRVAGPPYALEETTPGTESYIIEGAGDGRFSWQDLNGNKLPDVYVESKTVTRPGDNTQITVFLPVQFYDGCTPGNNGDPGANCSEPQEPYINIVYPQDSCCAGGGAPMPLQFRWEDPAGPITRRPKKAVNPSANPPVYPSVDGSDTCTNSVQFDQYCTSNRYDRDGYADEWTGSGNNAAPVLDGVFYCEGDFAPTGNARFFGSVLVNGNVLAAGTGEVWFDERLIKDEWPPKEWPFPRVIITAVETDN